MKRWAGCALHLILPSALYFLVLVGVQAAIGFGRGFGYDAAHVVPFGAGAAQIMHGLWPTDFALYIHGAESIPVYHLKTFTGTFGMYPPGLSYIDYAILKFWPRAPLYAIAFFACAALWSVAFTLIALALQKIFALKRAAFFVPLVLLVFPFFTNDLLCYATGMTEGIASPLFAIGCIASLLLFLISSRHNWLAAIAIGVCFAVASYIRAQFDFMVMGLMGVTFIIFIYQLLNKRSQNLKLHAIALILVFASYQAAIVPYKIFKHAPTIVVMDYAWGQLWTKKEDATKYHVYVARGMQSVCEIDPVKCQDFTDRRNRGEAIDFHEYKNAATAAVLHHPFALLKLKLPIFWYNWFIDMFEDAPPIASYRWAVDFILALGIPVVCVYAFFRNRKIGIAYTLYAGAFVGACTVFSLLVHIEPRYFLPIKALSALSLIFMGVDAWRRQRPLSA